MPIDVEALRHIPLFALLSREDLAQVAAMTRERYYERGELIVLEGEPGGVLHYVHSGLVKVFKTSPSGREQVLRLIVAGNTFNDVPDLDGGPHPASMAAMERSIVYVIQRAELRTLIMTRPEVAEAVVQTLMSAFTLLCWWKISLCAMSQPVPPRCSLIRRARPNKQNMTITWHNKRWRRLLAPLVKS